MDGQCEGVAVGSRGMTVEATQQCDKDKNECRALLHYYVIEIEVTILFGSCVIHTVITYLHVCVQRATLKWLISKCVCRGPPCNGLSPSVCAEGHAIMAYLQVCVQKATL